MTNRERSSRPELGSHNHAHKSDDGVWTCQCRYVQQVLISTEGVRQVHTFLYCVVVFFSEVQFSQHIPNLCQKHVSKFCTKRSFSHNGKSGYLVTQVPNYLPFNDGSQENISGQVYTLFLYASRMRPTSPFWWQLSSPRFSYWVILILLLLFKFLLLGRRTVS